MPAISISIVLVVLNLKELQWPDGHPTSEELNALQFAAKAHESFIIISVTDILLHRISYGLLCGNIGRVSLGFLSSPFHLASPVQYLFSWEFWGTALNPARKFWFHVTTACLILLLVFIGIAASPFSAISMIPRLGWWEPSYNRAGNGWPVRLNTKDAYPIEMTSQNALSTDYCDFNSHQDTCNLTNIGPMWNEVYSADAQLTSAPYSQNASNCRYGFATPDRPITYSIYDTDYRLERFYMPVATAPTAFTTLSLQYSAPYSDLDVSNWLIRSRPDQSSGMKTWKQPLVAVFCSSMLRNLSALDDSVIFDFPNYFTSNFTVDVNLKAESAHLNDTSVGGRGKRYRPRPMFLNIQSQIPIPISTAILFVSKVARFKEDLSQVKSKARVCLVQAQWVKADVWLEGQSLPAAKSDLGMSLMAIPSFLRKTSKPGNIIRMHDSWLERIANRITDPDSSNRQWFDIEFTPDSGNYLADTFLAVYFADALSLFYSLDFEGLGRPRFNVRTAETVYKYGYAYSFRNSITIVVAMVVLFMHVVVSLSHIGIIIFSTTPWTSSGWGSLFDDKWRDKTGLQAEHKFRIGTTRVETGDR
ncbi:hypothetical protein AK830_g2608 [Neonectria ditissima]|uniref:Uncharacterized protein n=1 Tax=Neonectria ditissima TaxID=78410 RepID=A0A0P7BR98_9HYPO|nr:hypothetical protein AK830_g2608 [Neonectria ditissima]